MMLKKKNKNKFKITKSTFLKRKKPVKKEIKTLFFYYLFLLKNQINNKINKKLFILKHNLLTLKKKNKYFFYLKQKNLSYLNNSKNISFFGDFENKSSFLKKVIFENVFNFMHFLALMSKQKKNKMNFYYNKAHLNSCGIIKTFLNFTNTFIILTNLKGEVKCWVSAGTAGFEKRRQRVTSKLPEVLSARISNIIPRKKFKYIKIKMAGPSKRFRSVILQALEKKAWIRKYRIKCVEDFYAKAYNGCRLKREKRR